jgi:DNA modification methylase
MINSLPMPEIVQGDARRLPLPHDSVDLIVTSPPYFGLRDYVDDGTHMAGQIGGEHHPREFIAALVECTREMMRVLKPSGSIFVNLGDRYTNRSGGKGWARVSEYSGRGKDELIKRRVLPTRRDTSRSIGMPEKTLMFLPERYRIAVLDELGLIGRAVLVWSKPNGMPESVKDRVRRSHEDWVHFTLTGKGYYADTAAIDPAVTGASHSVWQIPTQALRVPPELGIDHAAAFPMEWPRRLIAGWCPPGGTVLDPFGGSGTTALVAAVMGRRGISVDLSADYCRLAAWRASDPKERAKADGRTRPRRRPAAPPAESVAQLELVDGAAS